MLDINELRQRILNGESYTQEELMEAVQALRPKRLEAAQRTTEKRAAKVKAAPMSDEDLNASLRQAGLDF